jgi:protein-disulfide isomerase
MQIHLSAQKMATLIIIFAIVIFAGSAGYTWYKTSTETYIAGAPPADLINDIPPKSVPYNQIKPRALTPYDAFLLGSATSSYGLVFYGDYTNPASNALLIELISKLLPYEDLIRLNWHYLPETTKDGDMGFEAAIASECSRLLEPNWPLHAVLIKETDKTLNRSRLRQLVENLSMDPEMVNACQNNTAVRDSIKTAIQTAKGDGIDKAPFVFVGTEAIPATEANAEKIINALRNYIKN